MIDQYLAVRTYTDKICAKLITEDYGVQPAEEVSPPKWHLAHTTWFFETFILKPYFEGYKEFHEDFSYLFNSYYQTVGERNPRSNRASLSRPSVTDVYQYRAYVNMHMVVLMEKEVDNEILRETLILGLNHEQQHQELLLTDIKYIISINPKPPGVFDLKENLPQHLEQDWITIPQGNYSIGFKGKGFHWDNERADHIHYVAPFEISNRLVTNREYLKFIQGGGYRNFEYWHDEGWSWVQTNKVEHPLYWFQENNIWKVHTLNGEMEINWEAPVTHISFYEAFAYSQWKDLRLPTEFEWEIASDKFKWGDRWEWTHSAYLPYPGFKKPAGAIGEYNGKFMVNQMVLRGASIATPEGHSRNTYRNFFHPQLRWQFTGIRLAK